MRTASYGVRTERVKTNILMGKKNKKPRIKGPGDKGEEQESEKEVRNEKSVGRSETEDKEISKVDASVSTINMKRKECERKKEGKSENKNENIEEEMAIATVMELEA